MPLPRRVRRRRAVPLVCCVLAVLLTLPVFSARVMGAPPPPGAAYVALGDSYTSGPLIPNQIPESGPCERSDHDYPAIVAWTLRMQLHDVSCGGASADHMWAPQFPGAPRQLDAVGTNATLVTLGIGANDIGLLGIATTCSALGLIQPFGQPCKDYYTTGGIDQNARAIDMAAQRVADVLTAIHRHAPRARVLVIGYPDIFPETGTGCWPFVPIAAGDVPYLRSVEHALDAMLARQAADNGATYVDTYSSSVGHDVCAGVGTRWVEWLVVGSPAAPIHPNALAMLNDAAQILAALRH